MSNLNTPKEYYINFPTKYFDTKARIETRYLVNYIPSSEFDNCGNYEFSLQTKATWLLDRDPISLEEALADETGEKQADEFSYGLYAETQTKQASIEFCIPFLDASLKLTLKKNNISKYTTEDLEYSKCNGKWTTLELPPIDETETAGIYWKKTIIESDYKDLIPLNVNNMDVECKDNKIIFKNILQTNRPIIIKSNLILKYYDSPIPETDNQLKCNMFFQDDEQTLPTLNLENNIGNFSIISPNNISVDYEDGEPNFIFTAKVNAEKIKSFCVNIYNDEYKLFYSSGWITGANDTTSSNIVYNLMGEDIGTISKDSFLGEYLNTTSINGKLRDAISLYPNGENLYNNEILNYLFKGTESLEEILLNNFSKKLYYNFNLSTYSISEAWKKPFFTTKDYVIELAKPIEIKLYLEGKNDVLTSKTELDNTINKFIGNYSQSGNIPIDYYSFYLYDEYENLINSKEEIYSENIFYEYDAFEYGKKYSLKFFVRNKKGQTSQSSYNLVVKFPNYISISDNLYSYGNPNIKNNGVALLIEDKESVLENIISVLETDPTIGKLNFTLLRKEVNSNVSVNIYSSEINNEFLKQLKVSNSFLQNYFPNFSIKNTEEDFYGLIDYSAKNNKNYIYNFYLTLQLNEDILSSGGTVVVPSGVNLLTFQNTNSVSVLTHWDNYVLYPLLKSANDFCLCLDDDNNVISWKFGLNCEENEIVLNQDKTMFTTFDTKPKVIMGNLNYYSGSLKCLLGEFIENNSYYEPNSLLKSWEDFLKNSSCGLLKNPKGDAFVVFIENNSSRVYMNEIANEYLHNEELTVKPTTISFNYIEIDKINEKLYVQLGD